MDILDFSVSMAVGIFIEFNKLTKNIKCYIINVDKKGGELLNVIR